MLYVLHIALCVTTAARLREHATAEHVEKSSLVKVAAGICRQGSAARRQPRPSSLYACFAGVPNSTPSPAMFGQG